MPHLDAIEINDKNSKKSDKIQEYFIRKLDDGSFLLKGISDNGESFEYSYDNIDDLLNDVRDDLKNENGDQNNDTKSPEIKDAMSKIMRGQENDDQSNK